MLGHLSFGVAYLGRAIAFYETALRLGGRDAGPPGPRAHYGPKYYAAFVFDLDGYKLEPVYQLRRSLCECIASRVSAIDTA